MTAGAQVVVVEDEGLVALSLQRKLEKLGYRVPAVVATGEEAVELAGELNPDLFLMDIMLDGVMDGVDAASRIRERADVPVVFLTAYSDDVTIERAKAADPIGYLVKPFEDRELRTTIEMALSKHRTGAEMRRQQDHLQSLVKELSRALVGAKGQAEAADRAKSEFLGTMSHEMRTPLIGVLGMAELLLGTDLSDRQQHYAEVVMNSGRSLLEMINEMLDFSKIEAGKLDLEAAEFTLYTLIEETVAPLRERAAQKGLTLALDIAPDVPPVVTGEPSRLSRVLLHLIGNAIKFTDSGRIEVRARAAKEVDNGVFLLFEVEDTGIGIAPLDQTRIFDPFVQVDGSMTRRHGGTGLGLAIARRLVESMGGKLTVRSEKGGGSCFSFDAPFMVSPGASHGREGTTHRGSEEESMFDAEVLVAEDNIVNQEVVKVMLEWLGCSVTLVNDGREALAAVARRRYDAVLMDCFMPEVDGFTAAVSLRQREEKTGGGHVPIIAITANVEEGFKERCLASGMDAYLSKPFDQKQLASVLAQFIPRRRQA